MMRFRRQLYLYWLVSRLDSIYCSFLMTHACDHYGHSFKIANTQHGVWSFLTCWPLTDSEILLF